MDIQMTDALKKLIGDNTALLAEVETYEGTATSNAERVQTLERATLESTNDRKALRDMVRKVTGVTDLTEEALIAKFTGGDDALKSEVASLQERLQTVTTDYDDLGAKHTKEINGMKMNDMLRGMGIDNDVWNETAFGAISDLMLNGATYDNGVFTYKGEDGATVFGDNGKALTVEEKVIQLKNDESVYQFKPVTGGGGGQGQAPNPNQPKQNLSVNQRAAEMAKKI